MNMKAEPILQELEAVKEDVGGCRSVELLPLRYFLADHEEHLALLQ